MYFFKEFFEIVVQSMLLATVLDGMVTVLVVFILKDFGLFCWDDCNSGTVSVSCIVSDRLA